jgi:hypothetical protein
MIELISMAFIGGLAGSGLALIGVRQVRIFDAIVVFCNGMLLLALLTWVMGT